MHELQTEAEVRDAVALLRDRGASIGFVPTMGAFHEGHLSLIRCARRECGAVVVSIFVNPTQFPPGEDYERYPRDAEHDTARARDEGVDILFMPPVKEIYPEGNVTMVNVAELGETMCGPSRPGHFRGVATVVAKLLNIVAPDTAYFGQKDAQQAIIIKRMVRDLNMRTEIRVLPTVREPDGLAMSSRNQYLSPGERKAAPVLHRALTHAREMVSAGECNGDRIREAVEKIINGEPLASVEYVAVVNPDSLESVENIDGPALVAVAVRFGPCHLIDNCIVDTKKRLED